MKKSNYIYNALKVTLISNIMYLLEKITSYEKFWGDKMIKKHVSEFTSYIFIKMFWIICDGLRKTQKEILMVKCIHSKDDLIMTEIREQLQNRFMIFFLSVHE